MEKTIKLYKVTCRGMQVNSTGIPHGIAYVCAENPDEAYKKHRQHLDDRDIGFTKDRALESVELLAEARHYTDAPCILHL